MTAGNRIKLAVVALLAAPLVGFALYTGWVFRSGLGHADRLNSSPAMLEREALTPDAFPEGWLADLLLVEDPGFYDHNGIDLTTPGAGLTTLTQGLVKIHFFEEFKPGFAKIRQSVLALALDRRMSKRQQLSLFLNTAYLGEHEGRPVIGFAHAATHYFGKSVSRLSHDEFISLVAMLVSPDTFHVLRNPGNNRERTLRILALLNGQCEPSGLQDVYYPQCAPGSPG